MKKALRTAALLFIALCLFASCTKQQEDPNQTKVFTGKVDKITENVLWAENDAMGHYEFTFDPSQVDETRGAFAPGARIAIYYTGTFDAEDALYKDKSVHATLDGNDIHRLVTPKQVDAKVRTIIVTEGEPLEQNILEQPAVKLVKDYNLPAGTVKGYNAASVQENGSSSQTVWKNDEAYFPLTIFAGDFALEEVTVAVSDLKSQSSVLSGGNADCTFISETAVYLGNSTKAPQGELYKQNVPDILDTAAPASIPAASLKNVWVSIPIPADAAEGVYQGNITVNSISLAAPMQVEITLEVLPLTVPTVEEYQFDIELWQYPYRIAQYYNVEPFSEAHFEILKSHLSYYKNAGGHAITASIVNEPWNGQTYGEYPSMIKWTKAKDGSFQFDFTDFDAWVTFCREMGLGDKIICYSMIPWENKITYFDEKSEKMKSIDPKPGTKQYEKIWTRFLTALVGHTEEKGWFDDIYIGIDERPNMAEAFDVIEAVKGSDGNSFKISAAMDHFTAEYFPVIDRVDSISVGSEAVKKAPEDYQKLVERRASDPNLETTVYTCTGHYPNSFSYSMPYESYWTMLYCGSMGSTGFLRWALDAWVENPLADSSYKTFESGDCFLLYPDAASAESPQTKASFRFKMMEKGVRDMNKLYWLAARGGSWQGQVEELLASVKPTYSSLGEGIADTAAREQLPADMNAFIDSMNQLCRSYSQSEGTDF